MSIPSFNSFEPSTIDIHNMLYNDRLEKGERGEKGEKGEKGVMLDGSNNMSLDDVQFSGNNNTSLGFQAGKNSTGNNNTYIGNGAKPTIPSMSNEIVLGNSDIIALRCKQTSIAGLSDERDKTNIQPLNGKESLEFINKIQAVEFEWDQREWYENGIRDGSKKGDIDMGFIAQQVLSCDNLPFYKIVSTSNQDRFEVAPARFIPLLVSAIQELYRLQKGNKINLP